MRVISLTPATIKSVWNPARLAGEKGAARKAGAEAVCELFSPAGVREYRAAKQPSHPPSYSR